MSDSRCPPPPYSASMRPSWSAGGAPRAGPGVVVAVRRNGTS